MFPASETNGYIKKTLYTVQGLALWEVSLVYAVCTMLLGFGLSFPQVSPMQFLFAALRSVWTLSTV